MDKAECEKIYSDYESLLRLKESFENSFSEAVKSGNSESARKLKQAIEQKIEGLRNLVSPFNLTLREKLAREKGAGFVGNFHDGWAIKSTSGVVNSEWINKNGEILTPKNISEPISFVREFSEGYGWAVGQSGKSYLVDKNGEIRYTSSALNQTNKVKDGMSRVTDAAMKLEWYVNVETGKELTGFDEVRDFNEEFAAVKLKISGVPDWVFINKQGEIITEEDSPRGFNQVGDFHEGLAVVKNGQYWGFIDASGKKVITSGVGNANFLWVGRFSDGLAPVQREVGAYEKEYYFIGKDGKPQIRSELLNKEFTRIEAFSGGFAKVSVGGYTSYRFIDTQGKYIDGEFKDAKTFSEGFAGIEDGKGWTFIDKEGHYLTEERFERVESFKDSVALVVQDGRYYILHSSGKKYPPDGEESLAYKGEGVWEANWMQKTNPPKKKYFLDKYGKKIFNRHG